MDWNTAGVLAYFKKHLYLVTSGQKCHHSEESAWPASGNLFQHAKMENRIPVLRFWVRYWNLIWTWTICSVTSSENTGTHSVAQCIWT